MTINQTSSSIISIYNGISDTPEWDAGGYHFTRVPEYEQRIKQLPLLEGSKGGEQYQAQEGQHVVTFHATQNAASVQKSMWFEGGDSLNDILALWSFAGGFEVINSRSKNHCPTANECGHEIADSLSIAELVSEAYRRTKDESVDRLVKSALLTYLEVRHVHPLQLKATLLASVIECLDQFHNTDGCNRNFKKHKFIKNLFFELVKIWDVSITCDQIEALVDSLYLFRNKFLHSGIHPYDNYTNIKIGGITTTVGRVVIASRMLTKLAIQKELNFPMNISGSIAITIREFFRSGSFM